MLSWKSRDATFMTHPQKIHPGHVSKVSHSLLCVAHLREASSQVVKQPSREASLVMDQPSHGWARIAFPLYFGHSVCYLWFTVISSGLSLFMCTKGKITLTLAMIQRYQMRCKTLRVVSSIQQMSSLLHHELPFGGLALLDPQLLIHAPKISDLDFLCHALYIAKTDLVLVPRTI